MQSFFVGALAPRFDVAANQMHGVVHEGNAAGVVDLGNALLEQALPDPRPD